jgi:glycerophosphoryl diester phosphodiesterase
MVDDSIIQIGHRGLMGTYPQNTLESFKAAIEAGLKMIEFDVTASKDGKLVIFHDDNVENITGGQFYGPINSFAFEELRKMNVHDNKGEEDKYYQIPTLHEVLDLVDSSRPQLRVNIELKGANTAEPTAKIVKEYLDKGWKNSDFIISSFRHDELTKFNQLQPSIEIAMLFDKNQWKTKFEQNSKLAINKALAIKAVAVNPGIDFVSEELVNTAHKAKLKVNVWTINNNKEFAFVRDLNVDGVFVNYLDLNL